MYLVVNNYIIIFYNPHPFDLLTFFYIVERNEKIVLILLVHKTLSVPKLHIKSRVVML